MKRFSIAVSLILLVAGSAFAQKAKESSARSNEMDRVRVMGATTKAGQTRQEYVNNLVTRIRNAGLLGNTTESDLVARLIRDDVKVTAERKNASGVKTSEEFSLIDVLNDLASRSKNLSSGKSELAQSLIEAMSNERGAQRDQVINKLFNEARALLDVGSKASDQEMASFTNKLNQMNKMVGEGKALNLEEAGKKVLTEDERKKLEECVRG